MGFVRTCLILFFYFSHSSMIAYAQTANGGWISFEDGSFRTGELELRGPWDFYWRRVFTAKEKSGQWPLVEQRVEAGRSWNEFLDLSSGELLDTWGFAIYRLRLSGLLAGDYSLIVPRAVGRTKLHVYLDGWDGRVGKREDVRGAAQTLFRVGGPEEIWNVVIEISPAHRRGTIEGGKEVGLVSIPRLRREGKVH